jgi:hypothetical protein
MIQVRTEGHSTVRVSVGSDPHGNVTVVTYATYSVLTCIWNFLTFSNAAHLLQRDPRTFAAPLIITCFHKSRDSSVGIATPYGLDGPGIESRWEARFSASVQTGPGAHPASYTMSTGYISRVKRPGRGVDHPPHLVPRLKKV